MIKTLYIKNFALIEELQVEFTGGLNILTGQTGAGKSIIIGALNMILGERADTDVIRHGEKKAIAEAVIEVGENPQITKLLEKNEIDSSDSLILRREIRERGSRAFINDTPATISLLREAGTYLVDLHGQHEHQQLLDEDHHRKVLDEFGGLQPQLNAYRKALREFNTAKKELKKLQNRESELNEKLNLYRFQVDELEEANLAEDEEEELETELNLLDHAEDLEQQSSEILQLGSEGSVNVIDLLRTIIQHLKDMAAIEPEFEPYIEEITSARISIDEMLRFTETYQTGIEFDPIRLEQLRQRQSELNRLQKKYNRTIPELMAYLKDMRKEVDAAENFDLEIEKLEKETDQRAEEVAEKAERLHADRIEAGKMMAAQIVDELQTLGMPDTRFSADVQYRQNGVSDIVINEIPVQCTQNGCDDIAFLISPNKGEAQKPLAKIASGGEISRIMLALKSVIAREQNLPVMIFDEIDSGISGTISEKVGQKMRSLSHYCQIIAITHQPQIASKANSHYRVEKQEQNGRTSTRIIRLSEEQHIEAVATLMSGETVTESTRKSARELVAQSETKSKS